MNQFINSEALVAVLALCLSISLSADETKVKPSHVLEVTKSTPKLEVRFSQIGYRSTLLFYTFKKQKAVLKLQFGNRDKTFPVSGTVYFFAADVTENGMKKWLNN